MVSSEGALRTALAALWANGGFEVILRLPGIAVTGDEGEQLGLATPQWEDAPVGPAVWRKAGSEQELLLSAGAIAGLAGSQRHDSALSVLQAAVCVVVSGREYVITAADAVVVAGTPCAYHVRLQTPVWA